MINNIHPKKCIFCAERVERIDYKDVTLIRRFVSSYGKISPKRRNGSCSKHQRMLATAVKRARYLALMPYLSL